MEGFPNFDRWNLWRNVYKKGGASTCELGARARCRSNGDKSCLVWLPGPDTLLPRYLQLNCQNWSLFYRSTTIPRWSSSSSSIASWILPTLVRCWKLEIYFWIPIFSRNWPLHPPELEGGASDLGVGDPLLDADAIHHPSGDLLLQVDQEQDQGKDSSWCLPRVEMQKARVLQGFIRRNQLLRELLLLPQLLLCEVKL